MILRFIKDIDKIEKGLDIKVKDLETKRWYEGKVVEIEHKHKVRLLGCKPVRKLTVKKFTVLCTGGRKIVIRNATFFNYSICQII